MESMYYKSILLITSLTFFYELRNSIMNIFNYNAFSANRIPNYSVKCN